MISVKLTNNFHNTTATVRAVVLDFGTHQEITLAKRQMDRAARKLCGIKDCRGGGPAGIRGYQEVFGKKLIVNIFPSNWFSRGHTNPTTEQTR